MAPVNASDLDWGAIAVTEAPALAECPPCDPLAVLEAAVAALVGAVSAEVLKDLSQLVAAAREGRLIAQLDVLQGAYKEAVQPFSQMMAAYKGGSMSGFSFIIQFVFGLLGLVGRAPALVAHVPFLVITAPFRWCVAKVAALTAARHHANQEARREDLAAVVGELRRQEAARGTQPAQDTKDNIKNSMQFNCMDRGAGLPPSKFDARPSAPPLNSSWMSM